MAGFNMAASMYGLFPNIYNNQVALNDLTDMDLYSPFGIANPMMSMNGSIFGGGYGMMYPAMPIYGGGYNYEDYYKNYQRYQDFMLDTQVRQQQNIRNADLRLNSPLEGVSKKSSLLHEKMCLIPMTTATAPPRIYASQISMILPPFGYFQSLAEPTKAYGKTKYNHNSNAYLPFDERVGRLSDLQPQLLTILPEQHSGMLHIFYCGMLRGSLPCFDFVLSGVVVLFMGRVESGFVQVFPPKYLLPFPSRSCRLIAGIHALAVRSRASQSLWQGERSVSQSQ